MKPEEKLERALQAVADINEMLAFGPAVPIVMFGKWEVEVQVVLDQLLTKYETAGDTDGINRVKCMQERVDKFMSATLKGMRTNGNSKCPGDG